MFTGVHYFRSMLGTWMTPGTQITHGWKQWPKISMMKQVHCKFCQNRLFERNCFCIGDAVSRIKLAAGDDAGDVAWMDAISSLNLYASHMEFIKEVVKRKGAAWDP